MTKRLASTRRAVLGRGTAVPRRGRPGAPWGTLHRLWDTAMLRVRDGGGLRLRDGGIRRLRDAGMTTAEYAIGTLAACGFAALLVTILRGSVVQGLLLGIIKRALALGG